jgi:hypothetical protein
MSPHEVHLNAAEGEEKRIPTQPAPDTHPDHETETEKAGLQIRIMTRKTETEKAVLQIRIMTRKTETENADQDHDKRNRSRECRSGS